MKTDRMFKYKVFLISLGVFCGILIVIGMTITGTPAMQRAISLDNTRLMNFSQIQYGVEEYYRQNGALPNSITNLPNRNSKNAYDPETKEEYEYNILSDSSYELCATFSESSEKAGDQNESYYYNYGETLMEHDKGYDCITFEIPSRLLTPTPYFGL